jgi:hypothetical protein
MFPDEGDQLLRRSVTSGAARLLLLGEGDLSEEVNLHRVHVDARLGDLRGQVGVRKRCACDLAGLERFRKDHEVRVIEAASDPVTAYIAR